MPKFRSKTRKGENEGEAPESVVRDQRTAAVEQASLAEDGLEAAPETTTESGAREVGVEYSGAPGAEQLSELIAQTGGDTSEEEARSEVDALTGKGKGTGDEDDDGVSLEDRLNQGPEGLAQPGSSNTSEEGGGGSGGTYGGVGPGVSAWQNPIVNPITGEGATEPTGSFLDYVETKTGRDESLDAGGGPVPGSGRSVADGGNGITVKRGSEQPEFWDTSHHPHHNIQYIEVTDTNNGTITRLYDDGGTKTTTLDGTEIDRTGSRGEWAPHHDRPPLPGAKTTQQIEDAKKAEEDAKKKAEEDAKKKAEEDAKKKAEEDAKKKAEEDKNKAEQDGDPGPDAPYRASLDEKLHDPLFQQYQASKNAGGGGDGATDPTETDDVTLKGGGSFSREEAHDQAVGMFGQPPPGEDFAGDHRAGTPQLSPINEIQPGPDQDLVPGQGHTEDPANAIPDTEPIVGMPSGDTEEETTEETTDDGGSFLPPGDFTLVDAPPDLPDIEIDAHS